MRGRAVIIDGRKWIESEIANKQLGNKREVFLNQLMLDMETTFPRRGENREIKNSLC
jgi:hypothetical protein